MRGGVQAFGAGYRVEFEGGYSLISYEVRDS
jgi:hypothetical protein